MNLWRLTYMFAMFLTVSASDCEPIVNTTIGMVRGHCLLAKNGREFLAFEGIPYAEAPVEFLRFKEPKPIKPWNKVYAANIRVACVQYDREAKQYIGDEDCLVLNIYTPKMVQKHRPLNIIVFIHGGQFTYDAGYLYRPDFLLQHDVIYVTINYRLGALGFLSTNNKLVSGNNGLKDQVLALKWIKANAHHFSGNPKSITLAGISAGAASVTFHYISPMSVGLFNRGIALSGTCLSPAYITAHPLHNAKELAIRLGCPTENLSSMIVCLQKQPALEIVKQQTLGIDSNFNVAAFTPVIEDPNNEGTFLSKSPWDILILQEDVIQDLPLLLENVKDEGLMPAALYLAEPIFLSVIDEHWTDLAPILLSYSDTIPVSVQKSLANDILDKYLWGEPISNKTFMDFVQILSDRLHFVPMQETAIRFAHLLNSSLYYNVFVYRGEFSNTIRYAKNRINYGVCHGDDLQYILPRQGVDYLYSKTFERMSKILVETWLIFAETGLVQVGRLVAPPFRSENGHYNFLEITSPFQQTIKITESLAKYFDFWLF